MEGGQSAITVGKIGSFDTSSVKHSAIAHGRVYNSNNAAGLRERYSQSYSYALRRFDTLRRDGIWVFGRYDD